MEDFVYHFKDECKTCTCNEIHNQLDQIDDASIFIGQVKHLEFDLIRNQSH